tara:strand:+ start:652 stop:1086 length:435 start_codon:yes stop_codon:yes gene_type:complete
MKTKDVLVDALKPYVDSLGGWTTTQLESLFLGFGDLSIFRADDDGYTPSGDLGGNHRENAQSIIAALTEIGIPHNLDEDGMFWIIESCVGEIREDLKRAVSEAGYASFIYFNPDSEYEENHTLQELKTFTMDPPLENRFEGEGE